MRSFSVDPGLLGRRPGDRRGPRRASSSGSTGTSSGPHERLREAACSPSITSSQRWGIPEGAGRRWDVYFKGGWRPPATEETSGPVTHQAALLEHDSGRRVAIAVLTDHSPGLDQLRDDRGDHRAAARRAAARRGAGPRPERSAQLAAACRIGTSHRPVAAGLELGRCRRRRGRARRRPTRAGARAPRSSASPSAAARFSHPRHLGAHAARPCASISRTVSTPARLRPSSLVIAWIRRSRSTSACE